MNKQSKMRLTIDWKLTLELISHKGFLALSSFKVPIEGYVFAYSNTDTGEKRIRIIIIDFTTKHPLAVSKPFNTKTFNKGKDQKSIFPLNDAIWDLITVSEDFDM